MMYYLLWKAHSQIPVEKVKFFVAFSTVVHSSVAKFKISLATITSNEAICYVLSTLDSGCKSKSSSFGIFSPLARDERAILRIL